MKRVLPFAIAVVIILAFWVQTPAQEGGKDWLTDMDRAMQQAEKDNKDLLLDFTGSDWCGWCIRLNEEVFTKPEFEKVKDHFVLVELDFPQDQSKVPPETRKQNDQWQEKLGVEGFPTIFLTDAQGRPYAMTGYREGGVGPYVSHLAELRRIREMRDEAFAAAKAAQGAERAKHLHEGLQAMHGDFVVAHYRDVVQEIIGLDARNETGLQEQYKTRLAEADARQKIQEIAQRFSELASAEGPGAAAAMLKEELGIAGDNEILRNLIQVFRVNYVSPEELEDAAAVFNELLASESLDESEKLNLRLRRAYWLAESGSFDDAVKDVDDVIAVVPAREMKTQLNFIKAQMLEEGDRQEAALAAYEKMLELAEPGSEAELYGRQRLGILLVELGKPQAALDNYDRMLSHPAVEMPIRVNILSGKAAALLAAGKREEAVKTAQQAKELAAAANVSEIADSWLEDANSRIEAVLEEAGGSQ